MINFFIIRRSLYFINDIFVFNRLSEFVREMNRRFLILSPKDALSKDSDAILRERLRVLFTEWVKLYHHPSTSEQAHAAFVARVMFLNKQIKSAFLASF